MVTCPCIFPSASHSPKLGAASEVWAYFFTVGISQGPEAYACQCFRRSPPPEFPEWWQEQICNSQLVSTAGNLVEAGKGEPWNSLILPLHGLVNKPHQGYEHCKCLQFRGEGGGAFGYIFKGQNLDCNFMGFIVSPRSKKNFITDICG